MANNNMAKRQLSASEQQWVKAQCRFLSGEFEEVRSYIRDNAAIRHIEDAHLHSSNADLLNNVITGYKHGDSKFSSEETMYDAISFALADNMEDIACFLFDPKKQQEKLLIEEQLDDMDEPIGTGFVADSSNKRTNVQFTQKIHPTTTTGIGIVIIRDPRSEQGFTIQTAFPAVHPDLLSPNDILETDTGRDITDTLKQTPSYKTHSEVRKIGLRIACNDKTMPPAYLDYQEEHTNRAEQLFIMDKNTLDQPSSPAVVVKQGRNGKLITEYTQAHFESADRFSPSIKAVAGKNIDPRTFEKQNVHLIAAAEVIFDRPMQPEPARKGPAKPKGKPRGLTQVENQTSSFDSPDYP